MKNLFNYFLLKILRGVLLLNIIIVLIGLSIGYVQYNTIINYNISNESLTSIKIAATLILWYYILGIFFSIVFRNNHINNSGGLEFPYYMFGLFTAVATIFLMVCYIKSFNV